MSDGTTLQLPTAAGDTYDTEDLGARGKVARNKIILGAIGTDGGNVGTTNPFPVRFSDGTSVYDGVKSSQCPTTLGQKTMANSLSIVVASDQSAVPVSASSLPLPTGASTAAKQPALGIAGTASADVITIQGVAGMTAVAVSAASLPLPSGAATSANQDLEVASLSIIDDWDESDRCKVNLIVGQSGISAGAGAVGATTPRMTLASDDPAVAGIGGTSDAAATVGSTGSLSAKLRLMTTQLNTLAGYIDGVETALSGLALESGGNLATIAGIVTSSRAAVNLIAGQSGVTGGAGTVAANTERVTLASDDPAVTSLGAMDDWDESDRAKVNIIAGQAGVAGGSGVVGATTQRVVLATDVALPTGANVIGSVTNTGTFVVQENGAALTSLQLIDDVVYGDDAAFTPGTSKVVAIGFQADETATDSTDEGDVGCARMTLDRKVIVTTQPHTAGGYSTYTFLSTAAVQAAEIKGSAGKIYSVEFFNKGAAAVYVRIYNMTGTPGTGDTPIWRGIIPGNTAGSGFVKSWPDGIQCATGIGIRVSGAIADNDATALAANEVIGNVEYK